MDGRGTGEDRLMSSCTGECTNETGRVKHPIKLLNDGEGKSRDERGRINKYDDER